MKVVFQSNDGKIFTNAEECLEHENELQSSLQVYWDSVGSEMKEGDNPESAYFCVQDGNFQKHSALPDERGMWIWFNDRWVEIEELEKQFKLMKEVYTKFNSTT